MSIFSKKTDPAAQLEDVRRQHAELEASLPSLEADDAHTSTAFSALADKLRTVEGDHLNGAANDALLKETKAKHEAARQDDLRASARVRQARAQLKYLADEMKRLGPEVILADISARQAAYAETAKKARTHMVQLQALMVELHAAHEDADTAYPKEFPGRRQGVVRPYPVAAGLPVLSLYEMLPDPNATNGGRVGTWLRRVEEFLNPASVVPPKPVVRESPLPTSSQEPRRNPVGPWAGEAR